MLNFTHLLKHRNNGNKLVQLYRIHIYYIRLRHTNVAAILASTCLSLSKPSNTFKSPSLLNYSLNPYDQRFASFPLSDTLLTSFSVRQ